MNLRQISGWGKAQTASDGEAAVDNTVLCMTALVEGVAEAMPRIDAKTYSEFRGTAARMALQIPDRMENANRQMVVNAILHEFENYRHGVEEALYERQKSWHGLTTKLARELLLALGVKADSPVGQPMLEGIDQIVTAEQIREYRGVVEAFLELRSAGDEAAQISPLNVADTSTANDNAAGLLGGGAAVEHLQQVLDRGLTGFVAIFRLSCLEMVSRRFGVEAVEDCLMAVSAFLTASLNSDDAIYHWSDSSLVAILLHRPNEHLVTAELTRIAAKNSDINVNIGGRSIMLRIPFSFDLIALERFKNAAELYKLSLPAAKKR
ncbi:MAG: diguanylate cyclase [Terracidiphilus sp.]|jgi:GGDEF domain-containing protein